MTAKAYPVCPHDRETFECENNVSSYRCPTCEGRVCLDCRRYGEKDFMIPLVSWMTGLCEDCYREQGVRQKVRHDYERARQQRTRKQEAWDEGFAAGWAAQDPDDHAPNPYAEPDEHGDEVWLLDKHDWLRREVRS